MAVVMYASLFVLNGHAVSNAIPTELPIGCINLEAPDMATEEMAKLESWWTRVSANIQHLGSSDIERLELRVNHLERELRDLRAQVSVRDRKTA